MERLIAVLPDVNPSLGIALLPLAASSDTRLLVLVHFKVGVLGGKDEFCDCGGVCIESKNERFLG